MEVIVIIEGKFYCETSCENKEYEGNGAHGVGEDGRHSSRRSVSL